MLRDLSLSMMALTFEQVHSSWLGLLESRSPGGALDIGAGSGRDAVALNARGWCVTAVEPAKGLRMVGRAKNTAIQWLDDRLPALARLDDKQQFDLILLSAVWMHLPAPERPEAFTRLRQLLRPDGMVVISLRHGPSERARPMYPVSVEELKELAARKGLSVRFAGGKESGLPAARSDTLANCSCDTQEVEEWVKFVTRCSMVILTVECWMR